MTSSNGTVTTFIPNPYTPLAYLNPEQAYQTTVTNYASVGALAVNHLVNFVFQVTYLNHAGPDLGHLGEWSRRLLSAQVALQHFFDRVLCFAVRVDESSYITV